MSDYYIFQPRKRHEDGEQLCWRVMVKFLLLSFPLLLLIIAMYKLSGDAEVLGGRTKRSTYFCQTKGNDERNRKKPQDKL